MIMPDISLAGAGALSLSPALVVPIVIVSISAGLILGFFAYRACYPLQNNEEKIELEEILPIPVDSSSTLNKVIEEVIVVVANTEAINIISSLPV
jgi:hypothetical protein